jgi:hypothetical protein
MQQLVLDFPAIAEVEVNPFILASRRQTECCGRRPAARGGPVTTPFFPAFSLVVPIYNEEENVQNLLAEVAEVLLPHGPFEALLVDDGSKDRSLQRMREWKRRTRRYWLRIVVLEKNCGQSAAVMAGVEQARAPIVTTMDGDMQNDPRDLPAMVARVQAGECDAVVGVRRQAPGHLDAPRVVEDRQRRAQLADRGSRHRRGVRHQGDPPRVLAARAEVRRHASLHGDAGALPGRQGPRGRRQPPAARRRNREVRHRQPHLEGAARLLRDALDAHADPDAPGQGGVLTAELASAGAAELGSALEASARSFAGRCGTNPGAAFEGFA